LNLTRQHCEIFLKACPNSDLPSCGIPIMARHFRTEPIRSSTLQRGTTTQRGRAQFAIRRAKSSTYGLVWQILDPVQHAEAMAALKDIRQRFGLGEPSLGEPGTASEMRLQGIAEYLRVMLGQELRFFANHRERVFAIPKEYEAEYAVRSNALVATFVKLAN
jgi:hypothetical protein